MIYRP